ncbi:MAG: hypothetical protein ACKOU7_12275 [Ferruginibacter sp.]
MINKKSITLTAFMLAGAFIIYATFFKSGYQKEITISASVPVIHREISSLNKIARWFLPFAGADTSTSKLIKSGKLEFDNISLKISNIVGYSTRYEVSENNHAKQLLFNVMPDTGHNSKVTVNYTATLWQQLFNSDKIISNTIKSLENLKDYLGDSKKMYGYEVEMTSVTDTAFLFSSQVVPALEKKAAFKNLYGSLIQFAESMNLGYNGVRIFYMLPYGKDSMHLFTSIGISNTENAPLTGPFILKRMPYMGRLLKTYYQGGFGNVISSLDALNQYKSDNQMNSMAIPFIKLISEGIEFDDSQIIQANALYPVY